MSYRDEEAAEAEAERREAFRPHAEDSVFVARARSAIGAMQVEFKATVSPKHLRSLIDVVASALRAQAFEDQTRWTTIAELREGALFETEDRVQAVKSEYRLFPSGACECVLLASGEYAHFENGDATRVREIDVDRRGR